MLNEFWVLIRKAIDPLDIEISKKIGNDTDSSCITYIETRLSRRIIFTVEMYERQVSNELKKDFNSRSFG